MSFPAISARAMLEGFQLMGLDAEAIRERAGISHRDLAETDGHLPDERFARMWRHAFEISGRDSLGVEVAQRLPMGAFGIFDYLVASADCVGEALDTLRLHFGLVTEGISLEIDRSARGRRAWVRVHNAPTFEGQEVSDEFTLAAIFSRLRALAVTPFRVLQVNLSRPFATNVEHWKLLWGAKVCFRSPVSGICIPEDACAIRLKTADPRLQRALREVARRLLKSQPSFLLVARTALRNLLRSQAFTEARLARDLSMSVRSLQRRLRETKMSYRLLLDDVRHEEALRLLESTGQPLAQIARALGFREQASFTRAFRRWTGQSPRAWLRAGAHSS